MSVLGEVFGSLKTMSLLQLLLAYLACTGYAFAQGALIGSRGRRYAVLTAVVGALGFALESAQWTQATMLMAFAVAGMGLFVALVWLMSLTIGFARSNPQVSSDVVLADAATQAAAGMRSSPRPTGEHAHSL